jgi:hypothetical protein
MKKNILTPLFAVAVSLSITQNLFSQDVISEVKVAVLADQADISAVVRAAAQANPEKAAEIAQAAVKALGLKSNDATDEATIESVIQAAIEGSAADADQAKSIRALAESALIKPDSVSKPIQGGETSGAGNPLDYPGIDPLGSPVDAFVHDGVAAGTSHGDGTVGGNGIGLLYEKLPAGAYPGHLTNPGGGIFNTNFTQPVVRDNTVVTPVIP